jgi:antirestriction protein ArdC
VPTNQTIKLDYERAVTEALTEPGKISAAYSAFWNYSIGNQMLAMWQLGKAEPISTFPSWKRIGRNVKKGEKAITLLMPITKKVQDEETGEGGTRMFFIGKPHWFGLSQTDGAEYVPAPIPDFDLTRALAKLEITQKPFAVVDGNMQGYAIPRERVIAVSPIAFDPTKTGIHEAAHVLLHGDQGQLTDTDRPERSTREVEAELTAYLVKASLGITDGLEFSRGYIQNWLRDSSTEKVRFPAVFRAVDDILKAGRPAPEISAEPIQPQP